MQGIQNIQKSSVELFQCRYWYKLNSKHIQIYVFMEFSSHDFVLFEMMVTKCWYTWHISSALKSLTLSNLRLCVVSTFTGKNESTVFDCNICSFAWWNVICSEYNCYALIVSWRRSEHTDRNVELQPPVPYYSIENFTWCHRKQSLRFSPVKALSCYCWGWSKRQSKPVKNGPVCTVGSTVKNMQLTDFDQCSYLPHKFSYSGRDLLILVKNNDSTSSKISRDANFTPSTLYPVKIEGAVSSRSDQREENKKKFKNNFTAPILKPIYMTKNGGLFVRINGVYAIIHCCFLQRKQFCL